jgi:hypothetical protein
MTLATHVVVGGAVASLFPSHPILAFFAGFFSHFVLDAIPHWDYKILSAYSCRTSADTLSKEIKADKYFYLDLLRTGADTFLGIVVILLIWQPVVFAEWEILALGAVGGILPDFLYFVYMHFPYEPMILIKKFHDFMNIDHRFADKPFIGISLQVVIIICVTLLAKYLILL